MNDEHGRQDAKDSDYESAPVGMEERTQSGTFKVERISSGNGLPQID